MAVALDQEKARRGGRKRNIEILKYGYAVRINHANEATLGRTDDTPRLAEDAMLTGICKLVALETQCSNAFVCLIDSTLQHVIAEATQTISPYDESVHATGDGLQLGVQSVDRTSGITHVTLPSYTSGPDHFISNPNTSVTAERAIFLDLHQESTLKDLPFMTASPDSRFYLEAPLKNASGVVVGIIGALDDKPRSTIEEINPRPMLDAARLVMEHLELLRLRDSLANAERLMQGLGHFNAGQSSLGRWMADNPSQANSDDTIAITSDQPEHMPMSLESSALQKRDEPTLSTATPSSKLEPDFSASSTASVTGPSSLQSSEVDPATMSFSPGADGSTTLEAMSASKQPQALAKLVAGQARSSVEKALDRAANLIRQAMDLEAACFMDISSDSHASLGGQADHMTNPSQEIESVEHADTPLLSENSTTTTSESDGKNYTDAALQLCKQLAFSTKNSSGLDQTQTAGSQLQLSEKSMRALVSFYPSGHVFNFHSPGLLSSGDDSEQSQKSGGLQSRRHKAMNALGKCFPGAQSLVFMPLYDNERQKLYCAFFGWIADSHRVLDDNDIIYVSGFANSIMCEVMRLETSALERAKTVFMSSISHELRSPLHGILAATELLQGTSLNNDQNELALMVNSCGQTLLDIINNLLEHANINNKVDKRNRRSRRKRHKARQSRRRVERDQSQTSIVNSVNLVEITEDTVISVVSGHALRHQRSEQVSTRRKTSSEAIKDVDSAQPQEMRAPTVVLDIEKRDDWHFRIDPGTWRRLVMNLVGNALKYTATGYVSIGMHLNKLTRNIGHRSNQVVLTVSDSGQGISEAYMKNKLYMPFAQEDQLSVGVGLGLSIVHRLVAELGGKISIDSEVDIGTQVLLTIPLTPSALPEGLSASTTQNSFTALQRALTSQQSVYFCGFDVLPALDTTPTGTMSSHALGMLKLKQSLSTLVVEWFAMTVTSKVQEATVCFVESGHVRELWKHNPAHDVFKKPYIVISAYDQSEFAVTPWPGIHTAMATPIGPTKLTRALNTLFRREFEQCHAIPGHEASGVEIPTISSIATTNTAIPNPAGSDRTQTPQPSQTDRILLVDDNEINLRILAALMRKLELSCVQAKNGQEAFDQFKAAHQQHRPFKHIFMDISMPVMDGLTSTRRIRAYEKDKAIDTPARIFALTGLGHVDMQDDAMASGIDRYFRKPVRLDVLKGALASEDVDSSPVRLPSSS